ncbi:MAG: hypothetical protein ABWX85_02050, partial [Arthrobacter sp.]
TDRWPVLIKELDEISRWVRTQAVPRLITGTEPPEPALPTRYEITVGHEDERGAMSMGSMTTAVDLYQLRLGAASARIDLADLISRIDRSPNRRQIVAWLEELTDEDVMERVGRLGAAFNYEADIVSRNVEVLNDLRDEALAFGRESHFFLNSDVSL